MRLLSHPFEILLVGQDKIIINKGFVYDMSTLERFDVPELSIESWISSPEPFTVSDGDKIYIKIIKEEPSYSEDPDLLIDNTIDYYEDPSGYKVEIKTKHYYNIGKIYGATLGISSSDLSSDDSTTYVKIGEIVDISLEKIHQYVMSDIFVINDYHWSYDSIPSMDDSDSDSDNSDNSDSDSDESDGGDYDSDSDSDSDSDNSDNSDSDSDESDG